jgi:uncharacterized membrane protein YfcA
MDINATTVLVLTVLFFASFVGSTFGFGLGLISMPILAFIVEIRTATPLVALVGVTVVACILIRNWSAVRFQSVWRLVLSAAFGIPVGLIFLKGSHDLAMKIVLAAVIVAFSLYALFSPRPFELKTERASFLFGFFSGVLGGAYNTGGPPVVIYSSLRRWPPSAFRATLSGFFFPSSVMVLTGHGIAGLWTGEVLKLYAFSLPLVIVAVCLGGVLHSRIPSGKFDRAIYILLIGVGALLGAKSIIAAAG